MLYLKLFEKIFKKQEKKRDQYSFKLDTYHNKLKKYSRHTGIRQTVRTVRSVGKVDRILPDRKDCNQNFVDHRTVDRASLNLVDHRTDRRKERQNLPDRQVVVLNEKDNNSHINL